MVTIIRNYIIINATNAKFIDKKLLKKFGFKINKKVREREDVSGKYR